MTNVDVALITGHDLRNDNISLLRAIGNDDNATPHPQLIKLFHHYVDMLTAGNKDDVMHIAGMAWAYSKFFTLYGEEVIYRKTLNTYRTDFSPFFKRYLLGVDPLLVALSFNSMAYLWFCTEEHELAERVIKRLTFLSSVWRDMAHGIQETSIELPDRSGPHKATSIWTKYVPSHDVLSGRNSKTRFSISKLLPDEFNTCITDVFTVFSLFKHSSNSYHTIPNTANYTLYTRIHVMCAKTIAEVIDVIKGINTIYFDPEFMFKNLTWKCTHAELVAALPQSQRAYSNQNVWLLLCWLVNNGKLAIDSSAGLSGHKWGAGDNSVGPAMFDFIAYHNKESILSFLDVMQYIKNRKHGNKDTGNEIEKLFKHYRSFDMTLDVKRLKIKRGVIINFLSAGLGDIFCRS